MRHKLLVLDSKSSDDDWNLLQNIFEQNFTEDKVFTPLFRISAIEEAIYEEELDYWFVLYDSETLDLYASCSLQTIYEESYEKKDTEMSFEIFDVLVEEKYRGNNYCTLLLLNIMIEMKKIEPETRLKFQIRCNLGNKVAFQIYRTIYGEPKYIDETFIYFMGYIE